MTAFSETPEPDITSDQVTDALRGVTYPGLTRDLVSFGMVDHVSVCDRRVKVRLALVSHADRRFRFGGKRCLEIARLHEHLLSGFFGHFRTHWRDIQSRFDPVQQYGITARECQHVIE